MQDNKLKSEYRPLKLFLPLLLLAFLLPVGCGEDSYGPLRGAQAGVTQASPQPAAPDKPSEPMLVVGDVTMPMPVPTGFKRIPGDHPLMRAAQNSLDSDEILLCLFERIGEAQGGPAPGEMTIEALLQRELLQVSTLSKWLNVEVSSLDFLKIKQPWQDESIEFNQSTLTNFEEAAKGRLSGEREFNYNMGMIDSSPLHISFMRVDKHTGPSGTVIYTCGTTNLVWRYGKILRITYSKLIENFGQIHGVVAESVSYIQKLQAIDRSSRMSSTANNDPSATQNSVWHAGPDALAGTVQSAS